MAEPYIVKAYTALTDKIAFLKAMRDLAVSRGEGEKITAIELEMAELQEAASSLVEGTLADISGVSEEEYLKRSGKIGEAFRFVVASRPIPPLLHLVNGGPNYG